MRERMCASTTKRGLLGTMSAIGSRGETALPGVVNFWLITSPATGATITCRLDASTVLRCSCCSSASLAALTLS
jgi:hypothetical protein